jgi:hypothetical protein
MIYDRDYFIKKFEAIPEGEIGKASIKNHCALWHCGVDDQYNMTDEAQALLSVISATIEGVYCINDDPKNSAKENILTKLRSR